LGVVQADEVSELVRYDRGEQGVASDVSAVDDRLSAHELARAVVRGTGEPEDVGAIARDNCVIVPSS
jgi:hypothetical protein